MSQSTDNQSVVIVGGGPVGLVLALSMQQAKLPVRVLEARKQGASYQDKRALALSFGTRIILDNLGVWAALEPQTTAINTIHVSQRGSLGRSKLTASDYGLSALGYVVAYGDLMKALDIALDHAFIQYEAVVTNVRLNGISTEIDYAMHQQNHTVATALAVVAEGGRSLDSIDAIQRNTKAYGHDALVSKVSSELPHNNVAYERFTIAGPMALLPNGQRDFSLVWTGKKSEIEPLLALDEADFLALLHDTFGDRVGRFTSVAKRMSFPLIKSALSNKVVPHMVVIGNSAQTMHPVAGQGFNVGLRDAASLVKQLSVVEQAQWGSESSLQAYADTRVRDTTRGLLFTDFLVTTFSNDIVGLSGMRSIGLGVLDMVAPAKAFLVNKMSYGK